MIIESHKTPNLIINPGKLTSEVFAGLNGMPGFKKWGQTADTARRLIFRPTSASIKYLLDHFPEAEWGTGEPQSVLLNYQKFAHEAVALAAAKVQVQEDDESNYIYQTAPYAHQRQAFLLSRDQENYALLMEPGTGKTKVILDNAAYLYEAGRIDALVIIAPNGVHRNWIDNEVPPHLPERIKRSIYCHLSSRSEKNAERLCYQCSSGEGLKIFAFNIESGSSKRGQAMIEKILCCHKAMLVVDESTRIKNPSAKCTKFLMKMRRLVSERRILTGTPVTNGLEDLYSQFYFLDPDIVGHDTFTSFKAEFCITQRMSTGTATFERIIGYKNQDELQRRINPFSFRVLKKDCLDLPEKIYRRHPIEMPPEMARVYRSLRDEYVAEIEGLGFISEEMAMTRLLRLQQITCNWFPTKTESDSGIKMLSNPICSPNPRLQALMDILEDIPGKVIIWSRFQADIQAITNEINKRRNRAVHYYGLTSVDDRKKAIRRFQEDPEIDRFVSNQKAGGIGITLTAAETVIYYSNTFSLEQRLQSEDRAHRIGQKHNVLYIDLQMMGTVDGRIIRALTNKKMVADEFTGDPLSSFLSEG